MKSFYFLFFYLLIFSSCASSSDSKEAPQIKKITLQGKNLQNVFATTPAFYRLQVASKKEWVYAFENFLQITQSQGYRKLLDLLGEETIFWCLEEGIFLPEKAHVALYKDIKTQEINDLHHLITFIPFSHVKKLHQFKALHTSDLAFLFNNFIQKHPKVHLYHLKEVFGWEELKYLYFLGAVSKPQLTQALESTLQQHTFKNAQEMLALFSFDMLKFFHEERLLSTSRFQHIFYRITPSPHLFENWFEAFGEENTSYMIEQGMIPPFLAKQAFQNFLTPSTTFSNIVQQLPTALIINMERKGFIDLEALKDLWHQELSKSRYSDISKLFAKTLSPFFLEYLEKKNILSPGFWYDYEMDQKLKEEFQHYHYSVLREKLFPLPGYFEKHQFGLLKKLQKIEHNYQTLASRLQRHQENIQTQYYKKKQILEEEQIQQLKHYGFDLSNPLENVEKKDEIMRRYAYLKQRNENNKSEALAEAERLFEEQVYKLSTHWQTL